MRSHKGPPSVARVAGARHNRPMGDNPSIPRGRLKRLTRLAGLATQVGAGLASERVDFGSVKESSEPSVGEVDGDGTPALKGLEEIGPAFRVEVTGEESLFNGTGVEDDCWNVAAGPARAC